MYEQPIYRPPSEAYSLILQLTSGCSYNKCTFCAMYKDKQFHVKSFEEMERHIAWAKKLDSDPERIFLADGNFMCISTGKILMVLEMVKSRFPSVKKISSYAGPLDLLGKSDSDLALIKAAGLDLIYLGVESGSDEVLKAVNKGVTAEEMITAGRKAKNAGFTLSCMIISGLGGQRLFEDHAIQSGKVISAINPDYFALLTLMITEDAPLADQLRKGSFELLTPDEIMLELKLMLENTNLENCVFRANHASNYLNLKGVLNRDRESFLKTIDSAISSKSFKPESWRGL